jgi:hypothetical protein
MSGGLRRLPNGPELRPEVEIRYGKRGFLQQAKALLRNLETFDIVVDGTRGRLLGRALPEIRSFYRSVHGGESEDTEGSVWSTITGSVILAGALLPLTQLLFRAIAVRRRMEFTEESDRVRIRILGNNGNLAEREASWSKAH